MEHLRARLVVPRGDRLVEVTVVVHAWGRYRRASALSQTPDPPEADAGQAAARARNIAVSIAWRLQ
jgi:hypothetical protein